MFKKVYDLLENKNYKLIYEEWSINDYVYSKVNDNIIGTNLSLESFMDMLSIFNTVEITENSIIFKVGLPKCK